MYNFCTLFNLNYLKRGVVLYESLKNSISSNFRLYIFTFDSESFNILNNLKLDFVKLIKLEDFENKQLLSVKGDRTTAEYCWTATPWIIIHSMEKFNLNHCIYLDADLYFYKNPKIILDELSHKDSILITEHDYSKKYNQTEKSGKYCVQFMFFKNDKNGIKALKWWADQCIKWCYNRQENGKFGDQKYIEQFPKLFNGVHVLKNKNQALAPWNIQKYINNNRNDLPVFFHFHGVKYLNKNSFFLGYYRLNKSVVRKFYYGYLKKLIEIGLTELKPEIKLSKSEHFKLKVKNIFGNNHSIKING